MISSEWPANVSAEVCVSPGSGWGGVQERHCLLHASHHFCSLGDCLPGATNRATSCTRVPLLPPLPPHTGSIVLECQHPKAPWLLDPTPLTRGDRQGQVLHQCDAAAGNPQRELTNVQQRAACAA